ncbi:hypothetical protein L810_4543 [Burkholderia sp. AU4i]|nr:hypothetical protein L810_4543 [Burkholderia sp. AU4i]
MTMLVARRRHVRRAGKQCHQHQDSYNAHHVRVTSPSGSRFPTDSSA